MLLVSFSKIACSPDANVQCVRIYNNKIYYLRKDYSPPGIYSIDVNDFSSSSLTLVFSDTSNDNKMRNSNTFDIDSNGNLYYSTDAKIKKYNLSTGVTSDVYTISNIRFVKLDPYGCLYLNYWSGSNTPKRLNLSNNTIINVTGFSNLNPEIRFDSDGNLYYSIAGANKIWKVDKNCPGLSDPNATSLDFTSYKSPLYNWITSSPGSVDDGVFVEEANVGYTYGFEFDSNGVLYFSDMSGDHYIKKVK